MAALALAMVPSSALAQDEADFSWTMPAKLGEDRNGDRVLDYANSAREVTAGPYPVRLVASPAACGPEVKRDWAVNGNAVEPEPDGGGCNFRLQFDKEGTYDVELSLSGGLDASSTERVVVQDLLIVAIGDSVASGEGNPDNRSFAHPLWESKRCHRSAFAGFTRAARFLEDADPKSAVTFVHLACSGATIPVGLLRGYRGAQPGLLPRPRLLDPQVNELAMIASRREVDAVLLSIGGNDIGFADIIAFCLLKDDCPSARINPKKLDLPEGRAEPLHAVMPAALDQLSRRYTDLNARLPAGIGRDRVFALEYFDPTHAAADRFCPPIIGRQLTTQEQAWAYRNVVLELNGRLRDVAGASGWQFVAGVADLFAGHGYCADTEDRWVRRLQESLQFQRNRKGTFHPNEEGHRNTADLIDRQLRPALLPNGAARPPGPEQPEEDGSDGDEPDDFVDEEGEDPGAEAEWGTSETVAAGTAGGTLLGGLLLAGIAGRGRRRGDKHTDDGENGGDGGPPPDRPDASVAGIEREQPSREGAGLLWELFKNDDRRVYRRSEVVEPVNDRTLRRRHTLELRTPETAGGNVPVALGWAPKSRLPSLALRGEHGEALPLLSTVESGRIGVDLLEYAAQVALGRLPSEAASALIAELVHAEPPAVGRLIDRFRGEEAALKHFPPFVALTHELSRNLPVVALLPSDGTRRVLTLEWEEPIVTRAHAGGLRARIRSAVGRRGLTFDFNLLAIPRPDHHVEIRPPAGLDALLRTIEETHGAVGQITAHRSALVRTAVWVGGLVTVLLGGASILSPELGDAREVTAGALVIPAALLAVRLMRRGEHPLALRVLRSVRALLAGLALLTAAAAAVVALDGSGELQWLLLSLTTLAIVVTLLLQLTRRNPREPG